MTAVLEAVASSPADDVVPTLATKVRHHAEIRGDQVCMREKRYGIWQDITWSEYWEQVQLIAHALVSMGVRPADRVAVHAENRPEWMMSDVAIIAIRAITVGLYPTNPAAEVRYLLQDSGARVLIAEDQEQVDKALDVEADCPTLEWIVYLEPRGVRDYDHPKLISWRDFLDRGHAHRDQDPGLIDRMASEAEPDDVVTLIYTSGTTGPPKGAMLTNQNVAFAMEVLIASGGIYSPPPTYRDVALSYLPLCHVAERAATTWTNAEAGVTIHFAESIDTVQANLREVQPTLFFAVPRIWEKIYAGILIRMSAASPLKKLTYAATMKLAESIGNELARRDGRHSWRTRLMYAIGYPLMFRPLRDRIGLRKVRASGSGAAPISPEVLKFFSGIGVTIYEIYGMTENSAVATVNRPGRIKLGTVGEPQPGTEIRLDEETGEILTRHPAVFIGYWNKRQATAETLDADGWLHTGDVGEWVDGTHLKIVDRLKDIIITSGGKNISPSEIENELKTSPFIKEAVVIGDQRPYLTALIGIELDTVGNWAQRRRIPYTTYRDLSEKREVLKLIQGVVKDTNDRFARAENIRKFRMIIKELDHEDGELTATQKVKRASLNDMFAPLVDDMYANTTRFPGGDLVDVHSGELAAEPDADALNTAPDAGTRGTAADAQAPAAVTDAGPGTASDAAPDEPGDSSPKER